MSLTAWVRWERMRRACTRISRSTDVAPVTRALQLSACMSPPSGICGASLLSVITMSVLLSPLSRHWPPTSGVLAMFLAANGGTALEPNATWPTMVSSLVAPIALRERRAVAQVAGALDRVDRDLEQANARKPIGWVHGLAGRPARSALWRGRRARAPLEVRFVGMGRRPPHLGRDVVAALAQRLHRRRKQQRLGDGDDLRLQSLLPRLIPEGGEVGRDDHAGDDLGISATERGDLRGNRR